MISINFLIQIQNNIISRSKDPTKTIKLPLPVISRKYKIGVQGIVSPELVLCCNHDVFVQLKVFVVYNQKNKNKKSCTV